MIITKVLIVGLRCFKAECIVDLGSFCLLSETCFIQSIQVYGDHFHSALWIVILQTF